MSSIPLSMSESYYPESVPYPESQPESIPLSIPGSITPSGRLDDMLNVDYDDITFKKLSNDKMIIFAINKNKNYISKDITFSILKKRNNIKFEDIDTFIREINNINNKRDIKKIFVYFNPLEPDELRIKYLELENKKYKPIPIVFITKIKKEKKNIIKEEKPNNIINNEINEKPTIEKKPNLNIESKIKVFEKILQKNSSDVSDLKQKIPLIYNKNRISQISKVLNVNKANMDCELLFSLKRDGNEIEKFHNFVKNSYPTLLFFETYDKQNYFYYIPESWESSYINDYQIKKNEKIFLYNFTKKKKIFDNKNLAIYCYKSYGPMIGEYNEDETEFINNLDFDCSMSLSKVFTSKKNIFKTADNFNQFALKELEVYKFNVY